MEIQRHESFSHECKIWSELIFQQFQASQSKTIYNGVIGNRRDTFFGKYRFLLIGKKMGFTEKVDRKNLQQSGLC